MSDEPTKSPAEACPYVVGDDGLSRWSDAHADAWIGMLETHRRLTRALEAELAAAHGLNLSELEVLGRLAAADERTLRLSAVASGTGLSLSRISRIIDAMERRELVRRCPSQTDARSVMARLTEAGLDLARAAQATHFASVQERFFERISGEELAALAAVFGRFAARPAGALDQAA